VKFRSPEAAIRHRVLATLSGLMTISWAMAAYRSSSCRSLKTDPVGTSASAVVGGRREDGQHLVALPPFEGAAEKISADESG